jgi:ABC-2 type transport system ATP-binding protein
MPDFIPVSVRARDLTKRYGSVVALGGVSFEAGAGEILGLLGPNGAGKTTALECILGLRRPDSGSVTIGGVDVGGRPGDAKQVIGAVLQSAALQDKITPRKALGLFASFYSRAAGVGGLIDRFGLADKADATFDSLSGGLRQRLFLALAFVNNPSVVVLDEPTAGLDPGSRRDLHDIIAGMRESGRTVLLSTHDLDEAQDLCDRVAILDGGRIVAAARPSELIAASRAPARVWVRTRDPLGEARLSGIDGVSACRRKGEGWLLETGRAGDTIAALARSVQGAGDEFIELRIVRPSLEDVFLALTGRTWEGADERDDR